MTPLLYNLTGKIIVYAGSPVKQRISGDEMGQICRVWHVISRRIQLKLTDQLDGQ
jgi:hypothetical protein